MRFYTSEQLGPNRHWTPEGYLLCTDVPVARTGDMLYADGEVPVRAGRDGLIHISRDEADVFEEDAIASAQGKDVVNDHPDELVNPNNYRKHTVGTMLNPHRGDGVKTQPDMLYADLLVKDASAIRDVLAGKREVSLGYEADYDELEPGRGRQRKIRVNHVALVDRGRCGPRCAIGDHDMPSRRNSWMDRVLRAFRTHDEEALVEELQKIPDMVGEVVSGEDMPEMHPEKRPTGDEHHVTINLGHGGMETASGQGGGVAAPETHDEPADLGAGADAGGGGEMDEIMARLDRLEEAVMLLAGADEEQGGAEEAGAGGEGEASVEEQLAGGEDIDAGEDAEELDTQEEPGDVAGAADEPTARDSSLGTELRNREWEEPRETTGDRRTARTRTVRGRTGDSAGYATAWTNAMSRAELIVPGIKKPTFDAKRPRKVTFDALCAFRKRVLRAGMSFDASAGAIRSVLGPNKIDSLTCDSARIIFDAAAAIMAAGNNARSARRTADIAPVTVGSGAVAQGPRMTPAQINARNRERFGYTQATK